MVLGSPNKAEASSEVARHIARTAAQLFAKHGYDATSVREIVEAAGVTKPTLYYHFRSKEGLAHALLNVPLSGLVETLREIAVAGDDPVTTLERLFEAQFDFCREEPDRARMYHAACFGPLGSGLAEDFLQFIEPLNWPFHETIRRMVEAGIVASDRADDFDWMCRGLVKSAVTEFLYMNREIEPGLARRIVNDLLRGLGTADHTGRGT